MQRLAEFQVTSRDLFTMPQRLPARNGVLDPRLGVSDKVSTCATCKLKLADCAGHFGYIRLALPVFHIGYLKHTLNLLQCICKSCSRVLLTDAERKMLLKKMRNPRTDVLGKASVFKKVLDKCKKAHQCPYCHKPNGTVKKVHGAPTLKIIHERYKGRHMEDEVEDLLQSLQGAMITNLEINHALRVAVEDLLPTRVLELFKGMTDDDCEVLWVAPWIGRPENLILEHILVPPVPIRPSVAMDVGGGSNEDDLTVKLLEVINVNVALELNMTRNPQTKTIMEGWDVLQSQVAQYINGDMPGLKKEMGHKPIRGLCQRLKGKQGRFRGNLSGKRVDFSARTVISPDPNLRVDQVGVPVHVAKIMTYPETVSRYNIEKLRQRVLNGPDVHPGANLIRPGGENSFVKSLAYADRERAAQTLRIGDIVERHMEDGDVVLFNRQPSLHKLSIMSHQVKVMPWRTFRFNICVCAPYNADFDGDEMNMHLPQTEEARIEANMLMGVHHNLATPRNGEPLVACSQDFLSAAYLITQRDQFFSREMFCSLVSYFGLAEEQIDVPLPAILKPVPLWTGKQVFTCIVKPNKQTTALVNFEMKEKNYDTNKKLKHFCPNDGWVAFRNSELISGNIAKKTIGDGSKTGLLYVLLRDCGSAEAARFMDRFSKLCSRYFGMHRGFSIGISDVSPSAKLKKMKYDILSTGYKKVSCSNTVYSDCFIILFPTH
jgi:DNA-directed RNA polymerase III subunit RPC1